MKGTGVDYRAGVQYNFVCGCCTTVSKDGTVDELFCAVHSTEEGLRAIADAATKLSKELEQLQNSFLQFGQQAVQAIRQTMALRSTSTAEAELLVRLEEIMERDVEDIDLVAAVTRVQEDMKALSYGLLMLLRREEDSVLGTKHVFGMSDICLKCQKRKVQLALNNQLDTCTGPGV